MANGDLSDEWSRGQPKESIAIECYPRGTRAQLEERIAELEQALKVLELYGYFGFNTNRVEAAIQSSDIIAIARNARLHEDNETSDRVQYARKALDRHNSEGDNG